MLRQILVSPKWQVTARWVMGLLGMTFPGLLLVFTPNTWTTTHILMIGLHVPFAFVIILGMALVLGSCLVIFGDDNRDVGLAIGAISYLITMIGYVSAFFQGDQFGVFFFAFPLLAFLFLERSNIASRNSINKGVIPFIGTEEEANDSTG